MRGLVAVSAIGSAASCLFVCWWIHRKRVKALDDDWSKKRQEERTGRIRAEVKLRTSLKELQRLQQFLSSDNKQGDQQEQMLLHSIGTVVSPYTKRMGTPRQPQLVPASRGYIQFTVQSASLSGIENYGFVWLIFAFHANTDTNTSKKTKIRPPRAPQDTKVGALATRSPHRPNPLGLSLVKLEAWDEKTRRLHVSGLDLCNNTPIYDIKPCVPWDVPGFPAFKVPLKVPSWVEQDDVIPNVIFDDRALRQLQEAVANGNLAPLYTNENGGVEAAKQTLIQILAQDPRSSHKGVSQNARGSCSNDDSYSIIFCETQVSFVVAANVVNVSDVSVVDFDESQYVDGIPLISEKRR